MPIMQHFFAPARGSSPTTILVVEDDKEIGEFLADFLREEVAAEVIVATDAETALTKTQTVLPHLLLVDYRLPGLNGIELCDHLRSTQQHQRTPVILMSANPPWKDIEQRHLPAIRKPFELEELFQLIREQLVTWG